MQTFGAAVGGTDATTGSSACLALATFCLSPFVAAAGDLFSLLTCLYSSGRCPPKPLSFEFPVRSSTLTRLVVVGMLGRKRSSFTCYREAERQTIGVPGKHDRWGRGGLPL